MAVTILEALQNADYNLRNNAPGIGLVLAREQLHNAVELLERGYELTEEVEPLIEEHGSVEQVPYIDA